MRGHFAPTLTFTNLNGDHDDDDGGGDDHDYVETNFHQFE